MHFFDISKPDSKEKFFAFSRQRSMDYSNIFPVVEEIIRTVRENGDKALIDYTRKFDHISLDPDRLKVDKKELKAAFEQAPPDLLDVLKNAKKNIVHYYSQVKRFAWDIETSQGASSGELWHPIKTIGVYVPGGTAPLISTILMTVVPAKVAGVKNIVAMTPPNKEGEISKEMLIAFDLVGVDQVFRIGGAQAIAALAYGTETIPSVDKIVGPGNQFVTAAKKLVFGDVGIDTLAGPSEVLILADGSANPDFIASDMLSQLEHDPKSQAVTVSPDQDLLDKVQSALEEQLKKLNRQVQLQESCKNGAIFVKVANLNEGVEVANFYAPEHCEVMGSEAETQFMNIATAGAIFVGENTPVATGDFIAGPSHVLPTGGAGRFSAGLSLDSFLKRTSVVKYSKEALQGVRKDILKFTEIEGLDAHKASVDIRFKGDSK